MVSLSSAFATIPGAATAVLCFMIIPGAFAVYAAVRMPGTVWASLAALWAVVPSAILTGSTDVRTRWYAKLPDGTRIDGRTRSIATEWIFPLLASFLLIGIAALLVWWSQRARSSSPASEAQTDRARANRQQLAHVLTSFSGFLALLVLSLPYAMDFSGSGRPRMLFATSRLFSMKDDDLLFWALWLVAIAVFFACVWHGVRPSSRPGAGALIAFVIVAGLLNVFTAAYIYFGIRYFARVQILPSPSLLGCLLIPPLALIGAGLTLRERRSHIA